MKLYFYLGKDKIDNLYNECVEHIEEEVRKSRSKITSGKVSDKIAVKLGELLEFLGIGLAGEIGAELTEQSAESVEVVTKLGAEHKLKIAQEQARRDQGSLKFIQAVKALTSENESQYVSFEIPLILDHTISPPEVVKSDKSAVLSGEFKGFKVYVRTSLRNLIPEEAWLRFKDHPKKAGVFGKMTYVDEKSIEVEPVAVYWA